MCACVATPLSLNGSENRTWCSKGLLLFRNREVFVKGRLHYHHLSRKTIVHCNIFIIQRFLLKRSFVIRGSTVHV